MEDVSPLISTEPLHEEWQEVLELGEATFFGVEGPADHPLMWFSPIDLAPGPGHGVIVTEESEPDVKLLGPAGNVIATYGNGFGSGPGEFRDTICSVWIPGTGVLVADGPNNRISVFTENGDYVREIHPKVRTHVLAVSAGRLWTSSWLSSAIDRVVILDLETGEALKELGGRYRDEPWAERFRANCCLSGVRDRMLLSVPYPYEIQHYSPDGDLLGLFGRRVHGLGPPEEIDFGAGRVLCMSRGGQVGHVAVFPDSHSLVAFYEHIESGTVAGGGTRIEYVGYFDLFTPEETWLTTIPEADLLPGHEIGAWTIATDGAFWGVVFGEFPRIVRVPLRLLD